MARRNLPSLNGLLAFEAAGRLGRMTLAADELAVSHGAISRHVRSLEDVLGIRLFEGPKNALRLTEAGQALLPYLSAGFEKIEAGVRAVTDEESGALDVSCGGTFSMRWLIPRLFRFRHRHPEIEIRLSASYAPVDFARERYEIAIRLADEVPPEGVVTNILFAEYFGPVLSHALAKRMNFRHPQDLGRAPILQTATRRDAWTAWIAAYGTGSAKPGSAGVEYEHFYYMLEAATGGLGVGIAPWPLVIDDIRAGRLIAPFGFVPSGRTYVVARPLRRNRKADAFCLWLEQEAAMTPPPVAIPHADITVALRPIRPGS